VNLAAGVGAGERVKWLGELDRRLQSRPPIQAHYGGNNNNMTIKFAVMMMIMWPIILSPAHCWPLAWPSLHVRQRKVASLPECEQ